LKLEEVLVSQLELQQGLEQPLELVRVQLHRLAYQRLEAQLVLPLEEQLVYQLVVEPLALLLVCL
jgi:hypothetical protein